MLRNLARKQDAFRYGSLVETKDSGPGSRASSFRGISSSPDIHYTYNWYQNPFTVGAYASFGTGQFKNLYPSVSKPASDGYLHFGGEAASHHHRWVSGALDSARRCVFEILARDGTEKQKELFQDKYGNIKELDNANTAAGRYYRGIYANSWRNLEVTMVRLNIDIATFSLCKLVLLSRVL